MTLKLQTNQSQSLKQMQRLIMSPQMQQAISLLQMPLVELVDRLEEEIEQNPLLENGDQHDPEDDEQELEETEQVDSFLEKELNFEDKDLEILKRLDEDLRDFFAESGNSYMQRTEEDNKLQTFLESSLRTESSLFDHLMGQAGYTFDTKNGISMAEALIGNFDESGFFSVPIEEVCILTGFKKEELQSVLNLIQNFDPPGVGARNLQESLLIQLQRFGKKNSLAYKIIEHHYQDLLHNKIPEMQKNLRASAKEINEAIGNDISVLDLHPGANFSKIPNLPIVADVIISVENEALSVSTNDDILPSLKFNRRYMKLLDDPSVPLETKEFIKQKIMSARWFCRNLQQRHQTIERIAHFLTKKQHAFFMSPNGKLQPLTMKIVAEELNLNESTIARAVANKYVDTPRGLFPLRYFFTNSYSTDDGQDISSESVRDDLLKIIKEENKKKPFSDEAISIILQEKGIHCARRTVAKYRKLLDIGNAHQRKEYA